jgi:hypothetical protein
MSTPKFTPGPWVVRKFPTRAYARNAHWVLDAIPDDGDKVIANAICQMASTNDDEDANARLIAAAPDLYAALKRWANAEQVRAYIPQREKPDWDGLMAATHAALAAADGDNA